METREKRPAGGRANPGRAGTKKNPQRSRPVQKSNPAPQIPREPVPEVHYTQPQPFSRGGFLLKLASLAAVVVALMMCLSLFFRVEEVVVSGMNKYTPWMVKEASGVEVGDSLLGISDARISGKIISALPYVKEARAGIKLPGTVYIEIVELEVTYAIEASDQTWWLIAADGRVIEQIDPSAASGYTRILGVRADAPRVEQTVTAEEAHREPEESTTGNPGEQTLPHVEQVTGAEKLETALTILENLEANGIIGQIAQVDVTKLTDITMEYGGRLHVVLGDNENLPYKIAYMAQAISQLESYETGELDVSFKFSEQALLNPET